MNAKEKKFTETVWKHYDVLGRHDLPWRKTRDPYRILVSEIMLQQTQASRVEPKYKDFLKRFPTARKLAVAPLRDVLVAWQGLGYNRRAKAMQSAAITVVREHNTRWPRTYEGLLALPGVGPYTAGAVLAFAFNEAVPVLETNIRTVYIHHFFKYKVDVSDAELMLLVEKTLDHDKPRDWYYALMDYGSFLKRTVGNLNERSKSYVRQSTFKGSDRQIRGAIIRLLSGNEKALTRKSMHKKLSQFEDLRIDAQLERLQVEGLLVLTKSKYSLP